MEELNFYSPHQDTTESTVEEALQKEEAAASPHKFMLPTVGLSSEDSKKNKKKDEEKKQKDALEEAKKQNKMIIGLSGNLAADMMAEAEAEKTGEAAEDEGSLEAVIEFLEDSIAEYAKYIENIGRNGLAAANLNYYRDDIQEVLDMLKYHYTEELKPYWEEIVKLDLLLRAKAPIHVREIGHNNFKQYQIINDPPQTHWWWYLNRTVAPPVIQPKFWELWKK
ncbi:MAG: hypothetical protein LWY06_17360 [Firmicutes bacterium]|nr:hypothetical protein [Bacillota bacterium]